MKVFIVLLVIGICNSNCVVFGKSLSSLQTSQNEDLVTEPAEDIAVLPANVDTVPVEKVDEYETELPLEDTAFDIADEDTVGTTASSINDDVNENTTTKSIEVVTMTNVEASTIVESWKPLEDTAFDIADEDPTIGTTASSIIDDVNENTDTKSIEVVTMANVEASTEENAINQTANVMATVNEFPEHLVKDLEEAENRNKLERNEEQQVVLVPVLVQKFWIIFSGSNPFGNETNENGTNENGTNENGTNENETDENGTNENGTNENGNNENGINENGTEDRDGVSDGVVKITRITIPDANSDMEMTNTSEYPQETIEKAGDDDYLSAKNVEEEQTMDPLETIDEKADTTSPPEELPLMLA